MRKFTSHIRSFALADRGVAALEFAFVLPFLLTLFFGLVDLTGLISLNRKITQSASVVADLVSQNRNVILKSQIDDYYFAVSQIMAPTPLANVHVDVTGYRAASGGGASVIWSAAGGGGTACAAPPSGASLAALMTAGNDLIVARVCTNYVPYIATFLGKKIIGQTSFLVSETITQRPRSTGQLMCYRTAVGGPACP